jgi:3-phenylpropionate/trans-cinnamate dioxygenase ferredoxin subunit
VPAASPTSRRAPRSRSTCRPRPAGDDWYAVDDECSHAAIPLSEGDVEGCEIECWLHGSRFDLRTGKPTGPPASEPVTIYPVRVDGDDVLVDVANPLND